jgi:5-methylcytosine-specific restriction endonuclease McrA
LTALAIPKPVKPPKRAPKRLSRSSVPRRSPLARRKGRIRTRRPVGTKRREAKAAGYVDPLTWQAVVEFYEGLCAYCETESWRERDHVWPVSKGGIDHVSNLVPACPGCNAKKGQSTKWQPKRRHPWMDVAPSGPNAKCCEGCCE